MIGHRVSGDLNTELSAELRDVFIEAKQGWPVATGKSKQALTYTEEGEPMRRRYRFEDPVWYVRLIRQAGRSPMQTATRLIYDPIRKAVRTALAAAKIRLSRGARG